MKGILNKTKDGWIVKWGSPMEYREPIHELPVDPEYELYCLESDNYKEVEFEIKKVFLSDKTIWYAKPNKELNDVKTFIEDEQIIEAANKYLMGEQLIAFYTRESFIAGAKWYREKISKK